MGYFLLSIIVLMGLIAAMGVKIVPQSEEYVVEQFGKYVKILKPGLNFITPILFNVAARVSILERQLPPDAISVITKDNVRIEIHAAVFYRVIDPAKSVYRIRDVDQAVQTTVKSIVRSAGGQLEFDELQSKREFISGVIQKALSGECGVWGIEITRTEVLDVAVDDVTKDAMQQQLNAERERRAAVTKAEGERQSRQLQADAELYTAQKQAEARKLLADAEAYATKTVGEAIEKNGQAAIDFEVRKLQITSVSEIAKSPNTKLLVLPTDITKSLGTVASFLEGVVAR